LNVKELTKNPVYNTKRQKYDLICQQETGVMNKEADVEMRLVSAVVLGASFPFPS
jgi:hypothetical protein